MRLFILPEEPIFPDPRLASNKGLLAIGGDLSQDRLLCAYRQGIFPWYDKGTPILWWSPNPRPILEPSNIKISKRLARSLRSRKFSFSVDTCFGDIIENCAHIYRADQNGSWILPEMIDAYKDLHLAGWAHSVEVWQKNCLVGGLYGVSIGRAFFGESMFHKVSEASKAALIGLSRLLSTWGFDFIDCQQTSPHVQRFGLIELELNQFLSRLGQAVDSPEPCWAEACDVLGKFVC